MKIGKIESLLLITANNTITQLEMLLLCQIHIYDQGNRQIPTSH